MCRASSVRVDIFTCADGADLYMTMRPPEHVDGFIEKIIDGIHKNLVVERL